jgi:hypothetical protein
MYLQLAEDSFLHPQPEDHAVVTRDPSNMEVTEIPYLKFGSDCNLLDCDIVLSVDGYKYIQEVLHSSLCTLKREVVYYSEILIFTF